jgi:hypothetical protein
MDTGQAFPLFYQGNLGWNWNEQHDAPGLAHKGWDFCSSYETSASGSGWSFNQLFAFELNENHTATTAVPNMVWRLAAAQNMPSSNDQYYNQPNVSVTEDGSYVFWGADWNNASGTVDTYRINLPSTWYSDLGGGGSSQTVSISGTVNTAGGVAINGVTVILSGSTSGTATTTAAGTYQFSGLVQSGNYTVAVQKAGYSFSPVSISSASLMVAPNNWNFTGTLLTASIGGTTATAAGTPIAGATVSLSGGTSTTAVTAANGTYLFSGLPEAASYSYNVQKTGYIFNPVSMSTSQLLTSITNGNFTGVMSTTPTFTVGGYLKDGSGAALQGVVVVLTGGQTGTVTSASDGSYLFANLLQNNSFTVTPSTSQYTFNPASQSTGSLSTNISNWNFTAAPVGITISGHVRDASNNPMASIAVLLSPSNTQVMTDASGFYQFTTLALSGNYTVTPQAVGYNFVPPNYNVGAIENSIGTWDFIGSSVTQNAIAGYVTDSSGLGISNVQITISGAMTMTVFTNAAGFFQFSGLPNQAQCTIQAVKQGYDFAPSRVVIVVAKQKVELVNFRAVSILSQLETGSMKVVGSTLGKGTINPDKGDTAKIYFKGHTTGTYELRIFTMSGTLVWNESQENLQEGMFEWKPNNMASGTYVAQIAGPGINSRKKIIIIR